MEEGQPQSPGGPPLRPEDCVEELLKFTLQSSVTGTLGGGLDIGLSKEYCSNLLQHNHHDHPSSPSSNSASPTPPEFSQGVPLYPLYKRLASALCHSIASGALITSQYRNMAFIQEDSSRKQKEDEWIQLVMVKGSELLNVLKNVEFELHVQEPFFSQFRDGLKTVEGRYARGDYNSFDNSQDVHRYASFSEMLEAESLSKVLPGVETIEEGVQIYRKFYSEEKERSNGVLAICVAKSAAQLYIPLTSMISGLSYGGIQRLLGFVHTVGSSVEALPPSRSTLLSSFLLPHNPKVKGSTLTEGARALAKHVNRSSSKYWGTFGGSDSNKNRLAKDVISLLIADCCWQNMHIVPPHGAVYEIRIADGYGARWSADGTKFIGFLEPYMEDGHSKGWKH
ncbi:uncharacterized protein LOC127788256 isoform X2 [Diospyros lotus]|uniref:uncharacterized protein LOC127788256 isoform X2 n=1 Tax=Diospyros lotus TaxID=55363 RepID=UPI00224D796F|nr:uncharacterized protein LOC127788256 isoform X2 [Diospyros lotus]